MNLETVKCKFDFPSIYFQMIDFRANMGEKKNNNYTNLPILENEFPFRLNNHSNDSNQNSITPEYPIKYLQRVSR